MDRAATTCAPLLGSVDVPRFWKGSLVIRSGNPAKQHCTVLQARVAAARSLTWLASDKDHVTLSATSTRFTSVPMGGTLGYQYGRNYKGRNSIRTQAGVRH